MVAGDDWDEEIRSQLENADLILFLVSRASIASEYITRVEFQRALQRHMRGEARLVPIIVRKCDWESLGLPLQALPPSLVPIAKYADPDDAWYDVRMGLKEVLEKMEGTHLPVPMESPVAQKVRAIPENATKLCDRTQQEGAFVNFYHELRNSRPSAPQVYLLIEDDVDRPEFLIDRLFEFRIAPSAARINGERRGACIRRSGSEYAYGNFRTLQISAIESLYSSFDLPAPDEPAVKTLIDNQAFTLYSHILLEQVLDGEKVYNDAHRFVHWFINEFWKEGLPRSRDVSVPCETRSRTQWLIFLVFRFSSLDPGNVSLRERLLHKLRNIFGENGQANIERTAEGAPCLLLPPPDRLKPSDIAEALTAFPFSSVTDRNRSALTIYEQLQAHGAIPRIDDVVRRLEQLRLDYMKTGTIQI